MNNRCDSTIKQAVVPALSGRLTVVKSRTSLNKIISLNPEGRIVKTPSADMQSGQCYAIDVDAEGLGKLIQASYGNPKQALILGVSNPPEAFIITSKRKQGNPHPHSDVITRSLEYFSFAKAQGWMLLDVDGAGLSPDEAIEIMGRFEGFSQAPKVIEYSSSSGIRRVSEPENSGPMTGFHIWALVADVSDLPRLRNTLLKRLWLSGHGDIKVSKAGSVLVRALFDMAVLSPERLVFTASPALGEGLAQDRPEVRIIEGSKPFDTAAITDLSPIEEAQFAALVEKGKSEKQPEIGAKRAAYVEKQAGEISKRLGVAQNTARDMVRQTLDGGVLRGACPLEFMEHGIVSVADVLMRPRAFDGQEMTDPNDIGGRFRAKFFGNFDTDNVPRVWSFDNGGVTYQLRRDEIHIRTGRTDAMIADIEKVFGFLTKPILFQQGGRLVHLLGDENGERIAGVDTAVLRIYLSRVARFVAVTGKKDAKPVTSEAPESLLKCFVGKGSWDTRCVPVLNGICNAPTLTEEGRLVQREGYDKASGLYLDFQGCGFLTVDEEPDNGDVKQGFELLQDWISTFPFVDEGDRAACLAMALTSVVRKSLPTAPLNVISATAPGSGKGLLIDGISLLQTGKIARATSFVEDENEFRKKLFSALLEGGANMSIDNINEFASVKSDALCSVATQETWGDRVLGISKNAVCSTRMSIYLNGNNCRVVGDVIRRSLLCRLDARCEMPHLRRFERDFLGYTRSNRAKLHHAALTILKAYQNAGSPRDAKLGGCGSFQRWDETVRGCVVWLRMPDPMEPMKTLYENDPTRAQLIGLLESWRETFGCRPMTVKDAWGEIHFDRGNDLRGMLLDIARIRAGSDEINGRTLGNFLGSYAGRTVAGLRLEKAGLRKRAALWKVEAV
jgi:hypothetical protein